MLGLMKSGQMKRNMTGQRVWSRCSKLGEISNPPVCSFWFLRITMSLKIRRLLSSDRGRVPLTWGFHDLFQGRRVGKWEVKVTLLLLLFVRILQLKIFNVPYTCLGYNAWVAITTWCNQSSLSGIRGPPPSGPVSFSLWLDFRTLTVWNIFIDSAPSLILSQFKGYSPLSLFL